MHGKRKVEFGWPIMTNHSESNNSAMYKISRIGLKCATMTVGSENQVYEMNKRRRIKNGRASFTVDSDSTVCAMYKRAEWTLDAHE